MAATQNPIKIHEISTVYPKDAPSEFSLPFTFFDMSWLQSAPVSRIFFFEFPEPNNNSSFLNVFLPKLKNSLSVTLKHYLPIVGHLTWPRERNSPVVRYDTGDGVSLTVAETTRPDDFDTMSGNEFRNVTELHSLLPYFPTSETRIPAITLQITLFPNKGFSIGYQAHHGVLDGKSVSLFMRSWAYLCKLGENSVLLPPELTPSFDRSFVEQQSELERIFPRSFGNPIDPEKRSLKILDSTCPQGIMLGTFTLTRENIDALKKSVYAYREQKLSQDIGTRVSTFTVSSAYAIVCLTKAKRLTSQKSYIGISMDVRGRLEPPIQPNYVGNCAIGFPAVGDTQDFLSKDGFFNAVESIVEGLDSLNKGLMEVATVLMRLKEGKSIDVPVDISVISIAGSPRFELYKTDFGWGRPKKVDMISIANSGNFCLSDGRSTNDGVEIGVALNKHEAEVFNDVFATGLAAC